MARSSAQQLVRVSGTQATTLVLGETVLRDGGVSCPPQSTFCLTSVARASLLYRVTVFPAFYTHFWTLGAASKQCASLGAGASRFTIAGLYSSSALQSSAQLQHSRRLAGAVECVQYTHVRSHSLLLRASSGAPSLHLFLHCVPDPSALLTRERVPFTRGRGLGVRPCRQPLAVWQHALYPICSLKALYSPPASTDSKVAHMIISFRLTCSYILREPLALLRNEMII